MDFISISLDISTSTIYQLEYNDIIMMKQCMSMELNKVLQCISDLVDHHACVAGFSTWQY